MRLRSRPNREDHAPPDLELAHEFVRDSLCRRSDVYRIERSLLGPPLPPICCLFQEKAAGCRMEMRSTEGRGGGGRELG